MTIDLILNKIENDENRKQIKTVFNYISTKLSGQNTVINNILQILNILVKFKAPFETLISCLLYETVKNGVSICDIDWLFGSEIANITYLATLMCPNTLPNDEINRKYAFSFETYSEDNEMMPKKVIHLSKDSKEDVEAFFIKLANIFYILKERSIKVSDEFYLELAKVTAEVTIPLARELKLGFIASQLDDLCFSYIKPREYESILAQLQVSPDDAQEVLIETKGAIEKLLTDNGFGNFQIKSRAKTVKDLSEKMQQGKKLEEIHDYLAIRIILSDDDSEQCFKAVELIHQNYHYLPERFKDYINKPKDDGYQCLHTTIIDENGMEYEIQVRTAAMDKKAQAGYQKYKGNKPNL